MTFQTIPTRIDSASELFATNTTAYQELVTTLRECQQIAIDGGHGRGKSIDRHHARGKVMARDRVDLVTDDNTPFLEFSTLAAWGQYNDEAPGAGIVTGIGNGARVGIRIRARSVCALRADLQHARRNSSPHDGHADRTIRGAVAKTGHRQAK